MVASNCKQKPTDEMIKCQNKSWLKRRLAKIREGLAQYRANSKINKILNFLCNYIFICSVIGVWIICKMTFIRLSIK